MTLRTQLNGRYRSCHLMKRSKKIAAIISIIAILLVATLIAFLVWRMFDNEIRSPEAFKNYIDSFGWKGYLVAVGLQILQVIVAFIPGEVVEIGAGYAFGWFGGTLVCMAGCAIASAAVFLFVKSAGMKAVSIFTDPQKINNLRFLKDDKNLDRTVFMLFFLPGTPKDLLTYFVGLTRMKLSRFMVITTIARLPSLVTSTAGGHFVSEKNYLMAIIVFAVTALISGGGLLLYNKIIKVRNEHKKQKEE